MLNQARLRHRAPLLLVAVLAGLIVVPAALGGAKIDLPLPGGVTFTPWRGMDSSAFIVESCNGTRYTSTGDKNVKASPGIVCGVLAVSGTSVTVNLWNDADGTCNANHVLGTLALTNGSYVKIPSYHSTGICVTVGGTSPDVTVFYK